MWSLAEVNGLCLVSLNLKAHPASSMLWAGCHPPAMFPMQECPSCPLLPTVPCSNPNSYLPRHRALSYAAWARCGQSQPCPSFAQLLPQQIPAHLLPFQLPLAQRWSFQKRRDCSTHPHVPKERTEQRASKRGWTKTGREISGAHKTQQLMYVNHNTTSPFKAPDVFKVMLIEKPACVFNPESYRPFQVTTRSICTMGFSCSSVDIMRYSL